MGLWQHELKLIQYTDDTTLIFNDQKNSLEAAAIDTMK
jgi:hypothetical protein